MRVAVFGASGIVGQHMMLCVPPGVSPLFFRRKPDKLFLGCDITFTSQLMETMSRYRPDVIVNLAGESNTDAVERQEELNRPANLDAPDTMARWCERAGAQFIQVSSQAVFPGIVPPYGPSSLRAPINKYGWQKSQAEKCARDRGGIIVRLTFILGARPIQTGRPNPVEQMLAGKQPKQVADRWFSPLFARDAARGIWSVVQYGLGNDRIVHLGEPRRVSRYYIAKALGVEVEPVSHDDFPAIAARPLDTTYAPGSTGWFTPFDDAIQQLKTEWRDKQMLTLNERAREIALFLKITEDEAHTKLSKGFGFLHGEVREDFNRSKPADDEALLQWYRQTEAYIWELSAYHCEPNLNYHGTCSGVVTRLMDEGAKKVLCLGDGIGDLTLALRRIGINAVYHDLAGSRTAEFAQFRFWMHGAEGPSEMSEGWEPHFSEGYDCVISLDFLEHVTDVPSWTAAVRRALRPGGLFCAQNAFGLGSGSNGSIPMHLERNDRFVNEWDPHLASLGFRQQSSNWYEVAA